MAARLSQLLCTRELFPAAERVACRICSDNLVLPLLQMLQTRGGSDSANGEVSAGDKEMGSSLARDVLSFLVRFSHQRLERAGWTVKSKGECLGSYVFRHAGSGEKSESPVLPGQLWQHELMQALSLLVVHGETASGEELWAVKVMKHSVCCEDVLRRLSQVLDISYDDNQRDVDGESWNVTSQWSIVDVLKFPEENSDSSSKETKNIHHRKGKKNEDVEDEGGGVVMRQFVQGAWHGANVAPFSEIDRQHCSPGEALETWHETSIAGVGVLALRMAERHRLLQVDREVGNVGDIVGAGSRILVLGACQLSAVINFLKVHHFKNVATSLDTKLSPPSIVMVETDNDLAQYAVDLLDFPADLVQICSPTALLRAMTTSDSTYNRTLLVSSYDDFFQTASTVIASPSPNFHMFDAVLVGNTPRPLNDHDQEILRSLLSPSGLAVVAGERHLTNGIVTTNSAHTYSLVEMTPQGSNIGKTISSTIPLTLLMATNLLGQGCDLPVSVNMWDQLFVDQDIHARSGVEQETGDSVLPLSMDVSRAQTTQAILLPGLVTAEEADILHRMAGRTARGGRDWSGSTGHSYKLGCEIRSQQSKLWEVLFLQSQGAVSSLLPNFIERVTEQVINLDITQQWGFQLSKGNFCLRVCEYHSQVAPSEALPDIHHYDQDSLVTVDVMLSDPSTDFTGAQIQTLESSGKLCSHTVQQYDALCFVSHKYHSVTPLQSGRRVVCVLEFWRGSAEARCVLVHLTLVTM